MKRVKKATVMILGLCWIIFAVQFAYAEDPVEAPIEQDFTSLKVGDVIRMGYYEQDENVDNLREPIEWQVLAIDQNKGTALVLSTYALEALSYGNPMDTDEYVKTGVYWGNSYICSWLNNDFMTKAFTEGEKKRIQTSDIKTTDKAGTFIVRKKIFLLSAEEVRKYLKTPAGMACEATRHTIESLRLDGGAITDDGFCLWWLRDMTSVAKKAQNGNFMSDTGNEAGYVYGSKGLASFNQKKGGPIFCDYLIAVRPAMWITIDQSISSLKLTEKKMELASGEKKHVPYQIIPENAVNKTLAWSSSDETVAKVDQSGVVSAISRGSAIIAGTTTDGSNLSLSIQVIVDQPIKSLKTKDRKLELNAGESKRIQYTTVPQSGVNRNLEWTSSDTTIAEVDQTGLVKGVSHGSAKITGMTTDGSNQSITVDITIPPFSIATEEILMIRSTMSIPVKLNGIKAEDLELKYNGMNLTAQIQDGKSLNITAIKDGKSNLDISCEKYRVSIPVNISTIPKTGPAFNLTNGKPVGNVVNVPFSFRNELSKGVFDVLSYTIQQLNNDHYRFTVTFYAPAGYPISVFNPPQGKVFMHLSKGRTSASLQTIQFDISSSDLLAAQKECTIKLYSNSDHNQAWIFTDLGNISIVASTPTPRPNPKPTPTPKPTKAPSNSQTRQPSGGSSSGYMSTSDLKELASFYFALYVGNRSNISLIDISVSGGDQCVALVVYSGGHTVGILMDRRTGEYLGMKKGR